MEVQLPFEISENIREIPSTRRYWFVRTFGGKLFEYYYASKTVGLLANDVPLEMIKNAPHDNVTFSTLKSHIERNMYRDNPGEATKLANQLVDFYHNMKVDDIVMMPTGNSDFIAFGRVTSNIKERKKSQGTFDYKDTVLQYPTKYHEIEWLTIKRKSDILGDFRPLLSSQSGLTNANKYGEFVESNISSFFEKDEYYYFSLFVDLNNDQELNAFDLFRYLEAVTKLYKHYCAANDIEYNEDLFLKIKIQSQGSNIWKWVKTAGAVGIVGILGMSVFGSDPTLEHGPNGTVASLKGNVFQNITNAYRDVTKTNRDNEAQDIENENKRIDLIAKKRALGLLTKEEIDKYQIQLIDSTEALKLKNVESKAVKIADVINN